MAKICDFVAYRAAHPGSAVRVQVHFAPMWPVQFWMAFWHRFFFGESVDVLEEKK